MAKRNPQIHAAQVSATGTTKNGDQPSKQVMDRSFLGISSKIAESTLCNRNWPWKNARTHFVGQPLLVTVDKFYPHAKGGPLYVDEPVTAEEEKLCEKKRPQILKEGLRYIVIKREMSEAEARAQLKAPDGVGR